jgi:acyl-CoA thioester hydrolase
MPEQASIRDGVHRWPLRVYYEDTDASGIVYYANHLKYAERARTEMLRALGLDHPALLERFGLVFVVRRCAADYLAPARLDDAVEVSTRLARLGGAAIDLLQEISRDGCRLVRLEVRLALLSKSLRPARLPAELRDLLLAMR